MIHNVLTIIGWVCWMRALWLVFSAAFFGGTRQRLIARSQRLIAGSWTAWLLDDFVQGASLGTICLDTTMLVLSLWVGFHDDDDWKRRRRRVKESLKVAFRTFAPSPIPMPGAA